jgi:putative transposase
MVTRTDPLSIIRQCDLLDLPRSTFYHVPKPISEADLELMKLIDRCHMELPFSVAVEWSIGWATRVTW